MTDVYSPDEIIQFVNCRLIRNHQVVVDDLWIQNGQIINPEPVFFDQKICSHRRIDCNGAIIAPGFIDIQINGEIPVSFFSPLYKMFSFLCYWRFCLDRNFVRINTTIGLIFIMLTISIRWFWRGFCQQHFECRRRNSKSG